MDAIVEKAINEITQLKQSVQSSIPLVDSCIEGLKTGRMTVVECTDTIEKISNACRATLHNVERLLPEDEDI
jgi:hypothetical protein